MPKNLVPKSTDAADCKLADSNAEAAAKEKYLGDTKNETIDCRNRVKMRLNALSWTHHTLKASEPVQQIQTKNCITDTTKWEKSYSMFRCGE